MTAHLATAASPQVGQPVPGRPTLRIDRVLIARFAGASRDFNPIHVDEEFARNAGLQSVIAHGAISLGLAGRLLSDWVGLTGVHSLEAKLVAPAFPGDELVAEGEITSVTDEGRISVGLRVRKQGTEIDTVTAEAVVTLPAPPAGNREAT